MLQNTISLFFKDKQLKPLVKNDREKSLLKTGDQFRYLMLTQK